MKTNEFISAVNELGYSTEIAENMVTVFKTQKKPLATIAIEVKNVLDVSWLYPIEDQLFKLVIEYASTPVPEREVQQRYKLRHRWVWRLRYLRYEIVVDETSFGNSIDASETKNSELQTSRTIGTKKEWEEWTGRSWGQLVNEFVPEEVY